MNSKSARTVRMAVKDLPKPTAADLARLRKAMRGPIDTSEIPEHVGPFKRVRRGPDGELHRPSKSSLTLRLDGDLVQWFKSQGPGYQSRMRQVLREYYLAQTKGQGDLSQILTHLRELAEHAQRVLSGGGKAAG